jgi:altronate dehydratase large subunit
MEFPGYLRPNGRAGIRNYVAIIPVTSCSNELACAIADGAAGSVPILHNYGCMRLKPDNERAHRTLAGLGSNPNVAATLLVEMGCAMLDPEAMAQEIAASGTPVELVSVKAVGGYQKAIEAGQSVVRSMMAKASLQPRVPLPLGRLTVGVKCGGSATISSAAGHPATGYVVDRVIDEGGTVIFGETAEVIGAEHLLARRAANEQVRKDLLETVGRFEQMIVDCGVDIRGTQPTPGNIMSGLTTIEEKSLGALVKTGTRPLSGVLDYGEEPSGPGFVGMAVSNVPRHGSGGSSGVHLLPRRRCMRPFPQPTGRLPDADRPHHQDYRRPHSEAGAKLLRLLRGGSHRGHAVQGGCVRAVPARIPGHRLGQADNTGVLDLQGSA